MNTDHLPDLGPCCECGRKDNVRTIIMLSRRGPKPGCGWGCVECGLPLDGAVAVVCDDCANTITVPKFVCDGYPVTKTRIPLDALPPDVFDHNPERHPES